MRGRSSTSGEGQGEASPDTAAISSLYCARACVYCARRACTVPGRTYGIGVCVAAISVSALQPSWVLIFYINILLTRST